MRYVPLCVVLSTNVLIERFSLASLCNKSIEGIFKSPVINEATIPSLCTVSLGFLYYIS